MIDKWVLTIELPEESHSRRLLSPLNRYYQRENEMNDVLGMRRGERDSPRRRLRFVCWFYFLGVFNRFAGYVGLDRPGVVPPRELEVDGRDFLLCFASSARVDVLDAASSGMITRAPEKHATFACHARSTYATTRKFYI